MVLIFDSPVSENEEKEPKWSFFSPSEAAKTALGHWEGIAPTQKDKNEFFFSKPPDDNENDDLIASRSFANFLNHLQHYICKLGHKPHLQRMCDTKYWFESAPSLYMIDPR